KSTIPKKSGRRGSELFPQSFLFWCWPSWAGGIASGRKNGLPINSFLRCKNRTSKPPTASTTETPTGSSIRRITHNIQSTNSNKTGDQEDSGESSRAIGFTARAIALVVEVEW